MLIAMIIALILCLLLVIAGVALWWIPTAIMPTLMKLIMSILFLAPGIAFGSIIIEFIIEDYF